MLFKTSNFLINFFNEIFSTAIMRKFDAARKTVYFFRARLLTLTIAHKVKKEGSL